MIKIKRNMVPKDKYYIKCPYPMTPSRIVVHNTANDASAINEIKYMIRNNNEVSFHYAVDDKEIVQGIEENRNAWHSGDGNGKGNREGIAIEICYSKSGGNKFVLAELNAVHLIVDILKRYNWGIDKVTKHQDYSKKYCPHRTLDMGWDRFINMIEKELKETSNQPFSIGEIVYNKEDLVLKETAGYGGRLFTLKKNSKSLIKKYHYNKELYVALSDINGKYYDSAWTKDITKLDKYIEAPSNDNIDNKNENNDVDDEFIDTLPESVLPELHKEDNLFQKFITNIIILFKELYKYIIEKFTNK